MSAATQPVTISVTVNAPLQKTWDYFTTPGHIVGWNFASDDWHAPRSQNDVRVGGTFNTRMEAKDGSYGFDFAGTYTEVNEPTLLAYTLGDGRMVSVHFRDHEGQTIVEELFEPESTNPIDMQRDGWQAILNNFKAYVESN